MAKKEKKPKVRKAHKPGPFARWWGSLDSAGKRSAVATACVALLAVASVAGLALGLNYLHKYVMSLPAHAESLATIELVNQPSWMPASLAEEIKAELLNEPLTDNHTFDPGLAQRVYERAVACPWVRKATEVRVIRIPADQGDKQCRAGRIRVSAEWRQPVVKAQWQDRCEFIDEFGVVLPRDQVPGMVCPIITGVALPPPPPGQAWQGEDLSAGLTLAKLLREKPYYDELTAIDVSNFGRRRTISDVEIQMAAVTESGRTDIRFGQLPEDGLPVYGPSVQRRIGYLDTYYRMNDNSLTIPMGSIHLNLTGNDKPTYIVN